MYQNYGRRITINFQSNVLEKSTHQHCNSSTQYPTIRQLSVLLSLRASAKKDLNQIFLKDIFERINIL